jgi:multidrug resistance protein, MATE family
MTSDTVSRTEPMAAAQSWAAHFRATVMLGLPLIGAQLAQMAINTTDVVMLGWLGVTQLAAGVLATQMFFIFYIFGAGFTNAVMPIAAHAQGRGDAAGVRRSVRMGLWVVALYSAVVMVPLWNAETILVGLGQDAELSRLAGEYMHVAQWGMFPALVIMGLRSFFTVIGRAQIILWATLSGALLNAILNYAFIFGHFGAPALGVVGAAVGSLGTNLLIAAVLIIYSRAKPAFRVYDLYVRLWRPDWDAFFDVLRLGLPISMTIIAEIGLFMMASLMMGWLGTIPLAAHGIAVQLAGIAFMIPLGLSHAATVRIGQAHGRNDLDGLDRAAKAALVIAAAVSVTGAVLFWLIPDLLIGLFLEDADPQSADVARVAIPLLAVAAAFQVADSLQVVGSGLLRGLKDTRIPMIMALFSYWIVGLSGAYVFGFLFGFGGVGIWTGLALGLASAALLMNWRFHRRDAYGLL